MTLRAATAGYSIASTTSATARENATTAYWGELGAEQRLRRSKRWNLRPKPSRGSSP